MFKPTKARPAAGRAGRKPDTMRNPHVAEYYSHFANEHNEEHPENPFPLQNDGMTPRQRNRHHKSKLRVFCATRMGEWYRSHSWAEVWREKPEVARKLFAEVCELECLMEYVEHSDGAWLVEILLGQVMSAASRKNKADRKAEELRAVLERESKSVPLENLRDRCPRMEEAKENDCDLQDSGFAGPDTPAEKSQMFQVAGGAPIDLAFLRDKIPTGRTQNGGLRNRSGEGTALRTELDGEAAETVQSRVEGGALHITHGVDALSKEEIQNRIAELQSALERRAHSNGGQKERDRGDLHNILSSVHLPEGDAEDEIAPASVLCGRRGIMQPRLPAHIARKKGMLGSSASRVTISKKRGVRAQK